MLLGICHLLKISYYLDFRIECQEKQDVRGLFRYINFYLGG